MNQKKGLFMVLAAAGLAALAYSFLWPHAEKTAAPMAAQRNQQELRFSTGAPQLSFLRIEPVEALPVPLLEPLHGKIAYDDDVTAKVFSSINGRVVKINVQSGQTVKAGQVLVWLDSPDYAQAVADLAKAAADQRMKSQALRRAKMLFEGEVLARKDYESTENDATQANAEWARARSRLKNLDPSLALGNHVFALRSPIGGIVSERQVNAGTEVRADATTPLFVVTDPGLLWVQAELPEKDLDKVHPGQEVSVQVDAYADEHFSAKVQSVGDVLDPATRRVPVRCVIDNKERRLKPEMFARVTPAAEGRKLPRIPNEALVTEGLYNYLFVEKQRGVLERRRVELAYRGKDVSYVSAGVVPGERVVTVGALLLNSELSGN